MNLEDLAEANLCKFAAKVTHNTKSNEKLSGSFRGFNSTDTRHTGDYNWIDL